MQVAKGIMFGIGCALVLFASVLLSNGEIKHKAAFGILAFYGGFSIYWHGIRKK